MTQPIQILFCCLLFSVRYRFGHTANSPFFFLLSLSLSLSTMEVTALHEESGAQCVVTVPYEALVVQLQGIINATLLSGKSEPHHINLTIAGAVLDPQEVVANTPLSAGCIVTVHTEVVLLTEKGHTLEYYPSVCVLSASGQLCCVGGTSGCSMWDLENGVQLWHNPSTVIGIETTPTGFSPCSAHIAVCSGTQLTVLCTRTGAVTSSLEPYTPQPITTARFTSSGLLATCTNVGGAKVFRIDSDVSPEPICTLDGHTGPIVDVCGGEEHIYSAGHDGVVCVWKPDAECVAKLEAEGVLGGISLSPGGARLASVGSCRHERTVRVWCTATFTCLVMHNLEYRSFPRHVVLSETALFTATRGDDFSICDPTSARKLSRPSPTENVSCATMTASGRWLVRLVQNVIKVDGVM